MLLTVYFILLDRAVVVYLSNLHISARYVPVYSQSALKKESNTASAQAALKLQLHD